MLDINFLPAMRYIPNQKVRALIFFIPAQTLSHQGPRVGALGGNVRKRNSPIKGSPLEPSLLGDLRNGDNDSPRKWNRIPGAWGISQEWGPEINEIEKRNAQPSLLLRPEWNKIHLWGGVESFSEKQQGVVTI